MTPAALIGFLSGSRAGYVAGFLACVALLGGGLFMQHVMGLEPCPLCIFQRVAFIALMALFLVAALHNPGRRGAWVYGIALSLAAGAGAGIAGWQLWLQYGPKRAVAECGADLEFMLQTFPLTETLAMVFRGSGDCSDASAAVLGLSLAGWALLFFLLLGALALLIATRRPVR